VSDAPSPDESLTNPRFTATIAAGLTYPWGKFRPAAGKTHRIADGISWASIPMPGSLGHINTWLLDDGDNGYAAVDTGLLLAECSNAWKALFAGDLKDQNLSRVICTHLHPDHIGLAGWLCKKFGVELWMTRGEWLTARMLTSDKRDTAPDMFFTLQRGAGWDQAVLDEMAADGWGRFGRMVYDFPVSYRRVKHGDVLMLGQHRWDVVVGSGHSPEHACLLNATTGVLVSGDQVLPRISSNVSVVLTEPEADPLGEWLDSIDRLLELPADLLVCPAHGEPFTGLHTRLIALRDEHHRRLDDVAAAMAEKPVRAVDCFRLLFNREINGQNREQATGEALAHLYRLERDGRAKRDVRDGVYWYEAA
jgi:glyoxylase-like metal-dependent hydrolase (beta-lactamase superfamily II)